MFILRICLISGVFMILLVNGCHGHFWRKNKGQERSNKLLRWACHTVRGEEQPKVRTCGCEGETPVDCNVGPLTLTDTAGNQIAATFCSVQPDMTRTVAWKGVLRYACLIQATGEGGKIHQDKPCKPLSNGTSVSCNLGPVAVTVNGESAQAFFCNQPVVADTTDSSCVRLSGCLKKGVSDSQQNHVITWGHGRGHGGGRGGTHVGGSGRGHGGGRGGGYKGGNGRGHYGTGRG